MLIWPDADGTASITGDVSCETGRDSGSWDSCWVRQYLGWSGTSGNGGSDDLRRLASVMEPKIGATMLVEAARILRSDGRNPRRVEAIPETQIGTTDASM